MSKPRFTIPPTVKKAKPFLDSMNAVINKKLDPKLLESVAHLDSKERTAVAKTLQRWSEQLLACAAELKSLEKIATAGGADN